MRRYDLTLLALKVEGISEKMEKVVKAVGGKVGKTAEMGRKPLAYRIKKAGDGHYLQMAVELPGAAVVELKKKLNIDKGLLRYLLVKAKK
ncbi:30S ribosomal protein S6 [Candidatus Amesbacteria bacterium]|nr:30S ribosomal protein S6 [Candidatus Amesbacteria bacterium]MBI2587614.1 30S ribosomal protein S6 [Candidatus Amesbacteria bacterium]